MTPAHHSITGASELTSLLQRCAALCGAAEPLVGRLEQERQAFLSETLGDSLLQLEVILRVIDEECREAGQKTARPGLLRRLFSRGRSEEGHRTEHEPPRFEVSRQGLLGNSWTVPLSDLIGFLGSARKSGILWVDSPEENFLIGLQDGQVMHASSSRTPEGLRLGEILVRRGNLTRRQLDRFLSQQELDGANVSGEAFLRSGMITEDELQAALAHQVQQLFHRFVHTQHAIFRFREGLQVALRHQVRINVNQLLLETARYRDESDNPDLRSSVLNEAWDSWQADLETEVASPEPSDGEDEERGGTEAAGSPEEAADPVPSAEGSAEGADEATEPEGPLPSEVVAEDEEGDSAEAEAADEAEDGAARKPLEGRADA